VGGGQLTREIQQPASVEVLSSVRPPGAEGAPSDEGSGGGSGEGSGEGSGGGRPSTKEGSGESAQSAFGVQEDGSGHASSAKEGPGEGSGEGSGEAGGGRRRSEEDLRESHFVNFGPSRESREGQLLEADPQTQHLGSGGKRSTTVQEAPLEEKVDKVTFESATEGRREAPRRRSKEHAEVVKGGAGGAAKVDKVTFAEQGAARRRSKEEPTAFVPWESRDATDDEEDEEDEDYDDEMRELPLGNPMLGPREIQQNLCDILGGRLLQVTDFKLGVELGSGSVGQVFKAWHHPSKCDVAVKVVRPDFTVRTLARNKTLEDILNEVKVMSLLGPHANIVGLVGMFLCGPDPAIAMEYMDGGAMDEVLAAKRKGSTAWRPPKASSFSWCGQLCSALHFLHDRAVPLVHRDVKPSNLFVSADLTRVKLGDFGLCRPVHSKFSLDESEDNRFMSGVTGSYPYMAPEVYSGDNDGKHGYDEKVDIFSAAVAMRTLVTGDPAYHGEQYDGLHSDVLARRVSIEGFRMSLVPIKYQPMAKLISEMWAHDPLTRPSAGNAAARAEEMRRDVAANSLKPRAVFRRVFSGSQHQPPPLDTPGDPWRRVKSSEQHRASTGMDGGMAARSSMETPFFKDRRSAARASMEAPSAKGRNRASTGMASAKASSAEFSYTHSEK